MHNVQLKSRKCSIAPYRCVKRIYFTYRCYPTKVCMVFNLFSFYKSLSYMEKNLNKKTIHSFQFNDQSMVFFFFFLSIKLQTCEMIKSLEIYLYTIYIYIKLALHIQHKKFKYYIFKLFVSTLEIELFRCFFLHFPKMFQY